MLESQFCGKKFSYGGIFRCRLRLVFMFFLSIVSDMRDQKKKMFHQFQLKCFEAVIFTFVWVIWNARNQKIFSGIDHTTKWCFVRSKDTHFVGYQVVEKWILTGTSGLRIHLSLVSLIVLSVNSVTSACLFFLVVSIASHKRIFVINKIFFA